MPIAADELTEIEQVLVSTHASASPLADLRKRFPHLAWIRCDASDVTETPFRTVSRFDLHLLDGSSHCVEITADPARATGIVLASRSATS